MLRVLTLSTLFPNAARPTLGNFVERQTLSLAALDDVQLELVSAVGLPPWPLTVHPHYAGAARLPGLEEWKGLRVHRPRFTVLPKIGERRTARSQARALLPLLRDIRRRFPFEIIDAEFFWPDGVAAMHLAEAVGVPFAIKARGGDIHYWGEREGIREQMLAAARKAGGLLAVSASLKRDMVRAGMEEDKILVHYTGVDLDRFKPLDRAAAKAALGVTGPLIVTAGALIPRKGQHRAIAALEHIPDATLILVGDGPDREALEDFAARRGLSGRTRFLGNRPHDELPALLGAADLMLLSSESEGLANVWVEALACGTPLVISDVDGAREVVDRPEAGRLVPREEDALAAAAREILAAPPQPAAVRRAAERFTWKANSEALRAFLQGLVK